MKFTPTPLQGVLLIEPRVFADERGFFLESYQKKRFSEAESLSILSRITIRSRARVCCAGLHYQIRQPQGKLLRVVVGEIFDVALDLRRNSPDFGKWFGTYIGGEQTDILGPPGLCPRLLCHQLTSRAVV